MTRERPRLCKVAIQSVIEQDYPRDKLEFILWTIKSPSHDAQRFLDSLEDDFKRRNWKIVRNEENLYLGGARRFQTREEQIRHVHEATITKHTNCARLSSAMENGNADVFSLVQFFWSDDNPLKAKEIVDDEPSIIYFLAATQKPVRLKLFRRRQLLRPRNNGFENRVHRR